MKRGDAKIAKKYGKSLFHVILTNCKEDLIPAKDLLTILGGILNSSKTVQDIFYSPLTQEDVKIKVADALVASAEGALAGSITGGVKYIKELIKLMVHSRRVAEMGLVGEIFGEFVDSYLKSKKFSITTAFPLTDEEVQYVVKADKIGADGTVTFLVDQSIIGGVIIQSGDTVYDNSLRNRIQSLSGNL